MTNKRSTPTQLLPPVKPATPEEAQRLADEYPARYSYRNGVFCDLQAAGGSRIIASFESGKLSPMTPERARQMHAARRAQRNKAMMLGKIDAVRERYPDLDLPDPNTLTDEQLIQAEGNADRLLATLYTEAFMKAATSGGNFRGLSEGYRLVIQQGDEEQGKQTSSPQLPAGVTMQPTTLLALLDAIERRAEDRGEVINVYPHSTD